MQRASNISKKNGLIERFTHLGRVGGVSLGVAGAASEHPLERVAEDPTGVGIWKTPTRMSGRDYKGGSGLERGGILPLYSNTALRQTQGPYTSSIEA